MNYIMVDLVHCSAFNYDAKLPRIINDRSEGDMLLEVVAIMLTTLLRNIILQCQLSGHLLYTVIPILHRLISSNELIQAMHRDIGSIAVTCNSFA